MTKRAFDQAPPRNAKGWRKWAEDNDIGVNRVRRAIANRKLKVRRVGKRMIVLPEDGDAYLHSLPEGPGVKPANSKKAAAEEKTAAS